MAKKEKEYATQTSIENVEQVLGRSEQFIEDNQKTLTIIMFAAIILIGGYWGAKKLYFEPQAEQAQAEMFPAQNDFENNNFERALTGDANYSSFPEIADKYSMTKPGKLAKYYAGVCHLHLGQFEEAIDYLSSFSTSDELLDATAKGALGDAYLETGDANAAIKNYKSATKVSNSVITPTYLMKLGLVYEDQKDFSNALKAYQTIKEDYKSSMEARNIEKYITRASLLAKN